VRSIRGYLLLKGYRGHAPADILAIRKAPAARRTAVALVHQLALKTYSTTKTFPRPETFSLVGPDARRAATSVGMNLMEGAMRLGTKEYRQFVGIARGSAGEVCYRLLLAKDLNYISEDTYRELRSGYDRVLQMLFRLSQTLGNVRSR
jgi:four helix bundle protein